MDLDAHSGRARPVASGPGAGDVTRARADERTTRATGGRSGHHPERIGSRIACFQDVCGARVALARTGLARPESDGRWHIVHDQIKRVADSPSNIDLYCLALCGSVRRGVGPGPVRSAPVQPCIRIIVAIDRARDRADRGRQRAATGTTRHVLGLSCVGRSLPFIDHYIRRRGGRALKEQHSRYNQQCREHHQAYLSSCHTYHSCLL